MKLPTYMLSNGSIPAFRALPLGPLVLGTAFLVPGDTLASGMNTSGGWRPRTGPVNQQRRDVLRLLIARAGRREVRSSPSSLEARRVDPTVRPFDRRRGKPKLKVRACAERRGRRDPDTQSSPRGRKGMLAQRTIRFVASRGRCLSRGTGFFGAEAFLTARSSSGGSGTAPRAGAGAGVKGTCALVSGAGVPGATRRASQPMHAPEPRRSVHAAHFRSRDLHCATDGRVTMDRLRGRRPPVSRGRGSGDVAGGSGGHALSAVNRSSSEAESGARRGGKPNGFPGAVAVSCAEAGS
jgi:hypothetical protein